MESNTQKCTRGVLFGLAWGDVLGCPIESMTPLTIGASYGLPYKFPETLVPKSKLPGYRRRPLGLHSDDTQQALALIQTVLSGGVFHAEWAKKLTEGSQAGAWRGTGRMFQGAIEALSRGLSPKKAGSPSAGIGAAMRVAPLGALLSGDRLRLVALQQALVTHRDIRAAVVSYAVAYAVSTLLQTHDPVLTLNSLPMAVWKAEEVGVSFKSWDIHERERVHDVSSLLFSLIMDFSGKPPMNKTLGETLEVLRGPGTTANDPFCMIGGMTGLLLPLLFPDLDPNEVLSAIMGEGGDTDTVGAIAGGILGAMHGVEWIPVSKIFDTVRISTYADTLVSKKLPEDWSAFLKAEVALTKMEKDFQK